MLVGVKTRRDHTCGNPPGKLADAELHFTGGELDGLKLIGFSIWQRRGGTGRSVSFPARQYATGGERRTLHYCDPSLTRPLRLPADIYARSPRAYRGLEELPYPFHDQTVTVTHCGRICFKGQKVNLSQVFAGQNVGVTQVGERIWLVTFMHYDLGYFDDETCRLEPIENPFGPKVLPMCSE